MEQFMEFLASDPEAKKLVDEVFSEKCEQSQKCRRCVEEKIAYLYMRWLFGTVRDPVMAAREIHECLEAQRP